MGYALRQIEIYALGYAGSTAGPGVIPSSGPLHESGAIPVRAVLFDLDGTLLDIDIEAFIGRYFEALGHLMRHSFPACDGDAVKALSASTHAMMRPHPGVTNRVAFHADFLARTGIDLDASWETFERFYAEDFPALRGGCCPMPAAVEAVRAALDLGFKVAVATNPIFPAAAIAHRVEWAGLDGADVHLVTTYETMHATKPHPAYFRETASLLSVPEEACVMVGDDRYLDMAAADVGMRTYYVGPHADAAADYRGDLAGLVDLLPRLVARG